MHGLKDTNIPFSRFYPYSFSPQIAYLHDYHREPINYSLLTFKVKIDDLDSDFKQKLSLEFGVDDNDFIYIHVQRSGTILPSIMCLRPHYALHPVDISVNDVAEIVFPSSPRVKNIIDSQNIAISHISDIIVHTLNVGTRDPSAGNSDLSPDNLQLSINGKSINDYISDNPDQSLSFFSYVEGNGHKALTLHIIPSVDQTRQIEENIKKVPDSIKIRLQDALSLFKDNLLFEKDKAFELLGRIIFGKQEEAYQQAEAERLTAEQAERDRLAREEAERQAEEARQAELRRQQEEAGQQEEHERSAEAERQRQAAEQTERDRLAREEEARQQEEAERQRLAAEQAERDRLAREEEARQQEERERSAEAERLAAEQAERERLAREEEARQQAERERLAAEQAERDRLTREEEARQQAERERLAAEQAERDRLTREEADRIERERVEAERIAEENRIRIHQQVLEASRRAHEELERRKREADEQEQEAIRRREEEAKSLAQNLTGRADNPHLQAIGDTDARIAALREALNHATSNADKKRIERDLKNLLAGR
jgi:hypothetical protein